MSMNTETAALVGAMQYPPVAARALSLKRSASSPLEEFEQVYRRNVDGSGTRRSGTPQGG
jgi:hypothetical protein